MPFGSSNFPTSLDNAANLAYPVDGDPLMPANATNLSDAIQAVEGVIGTGPPGGWPTTGGVADTLFQAIMAALGGGGGGGGATSLLNYVASADLANALAITANVWTDIVPNQNFTVTNASKLIAVYCQFACALTQSADQKASRLLIDSGGTPLAFPLSGWNVSGAAGMARGAGVVIGSLSAAVHTVKVQVQTTNADTAYCRASSNPIYEFAAIQILQL